MELTSDRHAFELIMANTFFKRLRGLMFRPSIGDNEGLLLYNCRDIHCCFMKFTIDIVLLDENFSVIDIQTVRPWRISRHVKGTRHILEVAEGRALDVEIGEVFVLVH